MELNDSPGTSMALLWEEGKLLIRDKVISCPSHKKRKDNELENHLQQIIRDLEHATSPTQEIENDWQKTIASSLKS